MLSLSLGTVWAFIALLRNNYNPLDKTFGILYEMFFSVKQQCFEIYFYHRCSVPCCENRSLPPQKIYRNACKLLFDNCHILFNLQVALI